MRLSVSWLSEYVDLAGVSPEETGQALTMGIAEVEEVVPESDDTILVVDNKSLTHRPDLFGHVGIARELGAILSRPFKPPVTEGCGDGTGPDPWGLSIEVLDEDLCPRYTALVIDQVAFGPSPDWMAKRLEAVGVRSLNGLVDLTNYIMLELGQPLHAFDIDKIRGGRIVIRRADEGETIETLDGVTRRLTTEDLLIADMEHGIALAGVMGCSDSGIGEETETMVLESACFDPIAVRLTASRLGLRTEAVMRFEKSLDPALPALAARRFIDLLPEVVAGARLVGPFHDTAPGSGRRPVISLSTSFACRRLGIEIAPSRIDEILTSLEFEVERTGPTQALVTVPTFRATKDIAIPEDLVEELGRIHGYGNITPKAPMVPMVPPRQNPARLLEREVKRHLTSGLGFDEVMLYPFQSQRGIETFRLDTKRMLELRKPLSEENRYLKRELLPDLLGLLPANAPLGSFRLFEVGRSYRKEHPNSTDALPEEGRHLAGLCYERDGGRTDAPLFFELKGLLLGLFERLRREPPIFSNVDPGLPWFHPGRTARIAIAGSEVGNAGEVHPRLLRDLPGRAALFDIDLSALLDVGERPITFQGIHRFPAVTIDLTLIASDRSAADDLLLLARKEAGPLAVSVTLIALYRGASLPEGKKAVTLRIVYQSVDRTLTEEEVLRERDKLIGRLTEAGFPVR